ncbi:hypothetical protein FSP39_020301 [Pinctada imbricata]|uniref:Uncharacterized protein n=1 Tax=Pinctada imbricata TaxID=66713 RepID=A0AA89BXR1_PINIB|nr:hypothetical protein FSP39_020301 [Pinctada imbricata]
MAVCLFHDDKLQFDIVCKDIVRAKVLPRTCAHRLGMAVCACRRNKIEIEKFLSAEKLRTVISYINEHVLNRADLPTNLRSFIEKILFRNITLGDYSCCKFLSIMYDSLADQKYDQLSREATNSKTMTSATPEVAQANTKRKMNQKQFDIMMKRKLSNKDRTTRFSLPMFAGNVLKLKKNAQYEAMRKRYGNSVFVQFCDKENTEHITNNKTLTEVDVYAKEKSNAEKFITEARTHARAIQEAEEEKRKVRMKQQVPQGDWAVNQVDGSGSNVQAPQDDWASSPADDWGTNDQANDNWS